MTDLDQQRPGIVRALRACRWNSLTAEQNLLQRCPSLTRPQRWGLIDGFLEREKSYAWIALPPRIITEQDIEEYDDAFSYGRCLRRD